MSLVSFDNRPGCSFIQAGMIRRLRQMPNGGVLLMPDNPVVRPAEAYDGELDVLGRVI